MPPLPTKRDLLHLARQAAKHLGPNMLAREFARYADCPMSLIRLRFGSWAHLRRRIKLSPRGRRAPRKFSREGLVQQLRQWVEDHQGNFDTPRTLRQFCRDAQVSQATVYDIFELLQTLQREAQVWPIAFMRPRKYSAERLLEKLRAVTDRRGLNITLQQFCREAAIPREPVYDIFGSWGRMRQYAGLHPHPISPPRLTDEQLLADLHQAARWKRKFPGPAEYDRRGEHASCTIRRRFHSWQTAARRYLVWLTARYPAAARLIPEPAADDPRKRIAAFLRQVAHLEP